MKAYEQQPKLLKIHKNIEVMLKEAKKIIKSSSMLPAISPPKHPEFETLLSNHTRKQRLLSLFDNNHQRYAKAERRHNRSEHLGISPKQEDQQVEACLSQEKTVPIFYNKSTGRYELSSLLGRYQSQLMDSSTTARLAKRTNRELYNKKMINLLPEIPQKSKKKVDQITRQRAASPKRQVPYYRYHATINVSQDYLHSSEKETSPKSNTIDHDARPSKPTEAEETKNKRSPKKNKPRPRVRINESSVLQKLESADHSHKAMQTIEDPKCQPWNYDKFEESDDLFR